MTRPHLVVVGAAVMFALAALLGFVAAWGHPRERQRVAVFGDSLTFEASRYLQPMFDARSDYELRDHSLPGTAICDWIPQMDDVRDAFDPDVVAFEFAGNDILPCMLNRDGTQLTDREYLQRWRRDTERAIELFDPSVTIYLVSAPKMGNPDDRVFNIWRDVIRDYPNTHFVDGGRLVSPDRTFVATLPCLDGEPCTGPTVNGVRHNVVRTRDKVHFCPNLESFGEPCPVYSSGAYRFAVTIYEAITGDQAPRPESTAA